MGISGSVAGSEFQHYLEDEFKRRAAGDAQKLYLHQVQQLQPPQEFPDLMFMHLATLWKLDADHDGSVTFQELLAFSEFCNEKWRIFGATDFQSKLKAQCVHDLWARIADERGEEAFAAWVLRLVSEGESPQTFAVNTQQVEFIGRDHVMTLYELMKPLQISSHVDQQGFLDMLQQIGENMNLMPLSSEALDDWVPVQVLQRFVKKFIAAYANLFRELDLPARSSGGEKRAASKQ